MHAGDTQTLRNKRHFVISVIAINVFYCNKKYKLSEVCETKCQIIWLSNMQALSYNKISSLFKYSSLKVKLRVS